MTDNSPEILNFNTPRRPSDEIWEVLNKWCQATCTLAQEQWNEILKNPIRFSLQEIVPCGYKEITEPMTPGALGVHLKITQARIPSVIILGGQLTHALLADLLDLPGTEWPEERPFTSVETSMLEILFERIAYCIGDSLPGMHSVPCRFIETMLRPERTRMLSPTADYYMMVMKFECRFGEDFAYWILPRKEADEQLEAIQQSIVPEHSDEVTALETLACRIPLEIVIELGSVEVSMSTAMQLSLGDVIVLETSTYRPIVASLDGAPKWIGMPVKLGPRQAFQIRDAITH